MNEIQRLIHEMCPDGVPVGTLGELCTLKARIGWQGLTKKEYREEGDYLLITGTDFTPDYKIDFNHCVYVDKERYDQDPYIQLKDQDVLITKDGTLGKMAYIDHLPKPTTLNGGVFVIRDKSGKLNQKYMMYYMTSDAFKNMIEKNHTSGSIMHLTQKLLVNFQIPLPPLPIQQRIVEILDKFTSLVSSLDSEIALRQKQYEYYRNKLLSFEGKEIEYKKLGEVCDTLSGFPFDSSKFTNEGIRLMRGMNIKRGYLDFSEELNRYWPNSQSLEKYLLEKNDIVMSMDGSLVGKSFAFVEEMHLPLILVQRVARIRSTKIDTHYVYQCIKYKFSDYVDKKKTGGAIPHISMKDIDNFIIPFPSLDIQRTIVRTLDTFESLLTNLKKERELRQKQYEYYREKLLTFA